MRTMTANEDFHGLDKILRLNESAFRKHVRDDARVVFDDEEQARRSEKQARMWQQVGSRKPVTLSEHYNMLSSAFSLARYNPGTGRHWSSFPLDDSTPMTRYLTLLKKWATGRVVFITSSGTMGLGIQGTQAGDPITVLGTHTCVWHTPFVLRRARDAYLLIGEAYFDGFKASKHNKYEDGWNHVEIV